MRARTAWPAVPLLMVSMVLGLCGVAPAGAAKKTRIQTVCASKAVVHSTRSGGFHVADLKRGDRVIVISRDRSLAYVITGNGQGWTRSGAICSSSRGGKRKSKARRSQYARNLAEPGAGHGSGAG